MSEKMSLSDVIDEVDSIASEPAHKSDSENDAIKELFPGAIIEDNVQETETQTDLPVPEVINMEGVELHVYHGQFIDARELAALKKARVEKDSIARAKELEVLSEGPKSSLRPQSESFLYTSGDGQVTEITNQAQLAEIDVKSLDFNSLEFYVKAVPTISPDVFASNFGQILDQFEYFSSIKYVEYRNSQSVSEIMNLNQSIRTGMWELLHADEHLAPDQLERVFSYLSSPDKNFFHFGNEALFDTIRHDYGNEQEQKQHLGLYDRAKTLFLEKLTSFEEVEVDQAKSMVDAFWADAPYSDLYEAMIAGINLVDDEARLKRIFGFISNRLSLEEGRGALDRAVNDGVLSEEKRAEVLSALGFDQHVYIDVTSFYSEIMDDFEQYAPNQELQRYEEELLSGLDGTFLDLGFGAGRHLEKLWKDGRDVIGIDVVADFGRRLLKKIPDAKLIVGSWHNIPVKPGSIDNAYCLGRSILHNQSPDQYGMVFREVNKLLKENGNFIMDLPDFDSEHYVEARTSLAKNAYAAGIDYFEEGSIVDSPDGVNYMARFLPTEEQFIALARLAGLKATLIEKKDFATYEGGKNTNVYWRLEKTNENLAGDEILELVSKSRTGRPSLTLSYF